MMASSISKRPNRQLPDPRELNARLWKNAEFHTRLWTDPAARDLYAKIIHEALTDAVTGKGTMEKAADALSDIVMTQVSGELTILGLRNHFSTCVEPIKYVVFGLILGKMEEMSQRVGSDTDENASVYANVTDGWRGHMGLDIQYIITAWQPLAMTKLRFKLRHAAA